jgi:hypothetical protein
VDPDMNDPKRIRCPKRSESASDRDGPIGVSGADFRVVFSTARSHQRA